MAVSATVSAVSTSYILDQCLVAIYGLKLEIAIFLLAFAAHALLFGKRSILKSKGMPAKAKTPASPNKIASPEKPQPAEARGLTAEDICRGNAGKPEAVAAALRTYLATCSNKDEEALTRLLQGAGRSPTVEFLAASRAVAKEKSLKLNTTLGEWLLRGYYSSHATSELETLVADIEAEGGKLLPAVGLQAMKNCLRKGEFEASLTRLEGLREMWEGPQASPSAAPRALLQWLGRLAIQQNSLPILVQKLKALNLFSTAFELILAECAQYGTATTLQETEALGRKEGVKFTAGTYCVLLKHAKSADDALRLFGEAVKTAGAGSDLVIASTAAAYTHESASLADKILEKLTKEPPAEVAGRLLLLCAGKDGNDAKVLKLYTQHFSGVDLSGDAVAERLIVEASLRSNNLDIVKKLLSTTTDCTKRVTLLKQIGNDGSLDHAFKLFRVFPEKASCLYNALIDACIAGGRTDAVKDVMEEAIQAGVADIVTYNTIIKSHLLNGKTNEAQMTVQLMKNAGLHPNCVTFNELLDACIKQGSGEVWTLLDEMKACNVKPNHITCSILLKIIKANSSARNVERVLDVMDSVADEMDEVLLSSVVEACIRAGRVDLLVPHLKRQASSRRVHVRGPHTYGSIIRAYGFVNDAKGAWETWREMRSRQINPTAVTLGCMVEAVVSNGDAEGGYELIQEMHNDVTCRPLLNAVIYCSVLKGFSHTKKFDRFWEVYQEMLGHKVKFSIVTFNTMVDACSRNGEMKRIPDLLRSMTSQGIEPNLITYSAILKGYCQENRLDEAFELMEGMVQTTRFRPDEIMYNTLLDGCARMGMYDRGMPLVAEMEANGVSPSNFTLSVLVKLCSRSRRLDRAFEIVREVSAKYRFKVNVHVYSNLIQACIQGKDLARAFGVFEELIQAGVKPDIRSYSLLLRACVSQGEAQDAAGLMRAAAGLRGVHPRLMGFSATALLPQGGLPSALISEVIEGISGPPSREERLAVALLKDLQTKPNIKVDPKLQMRLTTQAVSSRRTAA